MYGASTIFGKSCLQQHLHMSHRICDILDSYTNELYYDYNNDNLNVLH